MATMVFIAGLLVGSSFTALVYLISKVVSILRERGELYPRDE